MIHNKSVKVYCVFSILLCLFYLETFIVFEYKMAVAPFLFVIKIKVLSLKMLTVKIFMKNTKEGHSLYIKYGFFRAVRLKNNEYDKDENEENSSNNLSAYNFIRFFLRHTKTCLYFYVKLSEDIVNNFVVSLFTYLSKISLIATDFYVGFRFDNVTRVEGASVFIFSIPYALIKTCALVKNRLQRGKKVRLKEVGV